MRGRADLYVAFFEAALHQLNERGVCAFICADHDLCRSWMRNQYGADLRELVTSAYGVEVVIEMHNADAFDDEVDAEEHTAADRIEALIPGVQRIPCA
jgi:chromosomal replication initiation ATPase DnaA